jgi:hypothetical protein
MRLAADCNQLATEVHNRAIEGHFLASDVHNRALENHLLRMATVWTARAEEGPSEFQNQQVN